MYRTAIRVLARTRAAVVAVLAWTLLAPAYVLLFLPVRLARRLAGRRDPLGLAFPGPNGSLWRERRPARNRDSGRRMF